MAAICWRPTHPTMRLSRFVRTDSDGVQFSEMVKSAQKVRQEPFCGQNRVLLGGHFHHFRGGIHHFE
jgi:hypothetical protein